MHFEQVREGKNPAYALKHDGVTLGTVFKNWQGWCWAKWSQPVWGEADANGIRVCIDETGAQQGFCTEEHEAREALLATLESHPAYQDELRAVIASAVSSGR